MSSRGISEVRDIIDEVYNSFAQLRAEDLKLNRVLYGRHHQDLNEEMLKLGFKQVYAKPSPAIDFYAHDAEAEMIQDMEFHCRDLTGRSPNRADAIEVSASWAWNKMNPSNLTARAIRRNMIVRPFAGVWQNIKQFKLPENNVKSAENEKHRRGFFPMSLEIDNGHQSAFLETGGVVRLAVRKVVKPLVEVMRDYDKKPEQDRQPFSVMRDDYDWIREGFGVGEEETQSSLTKKATIYRLDYDRYIYDCVEMPGKSGLEKYHPISSLDDDEPYPNPWGHPGFHFACGFWNPDADKPEDRYTAFLRTVIRERWNLDVNVSTRQSMLTSMPWRVLELPPEAYQAMAGMGGLKERQEFLDQILLSERKGVTVAMGELKQLDLPVPELLAKDYDDSKEEYLRHLPQRAPSDQTISQSTASAVTLQAEMRGLSYALPEGSYASTVLKCSEDLLQLYRIGVDSPVFNTPDAKNPEKLYAVTTGDEKVKGKSTSPGKSYVIGPDELGEDSSWYSLEVIPVDNTPSARAMRRQEAAERRAQDNILDEQYYELHGETDVSEFVEKLTIQKWMKMFEAADAAYAFGMAVQFQALTKGLDPRAIIAAAQGGPVAGQGGQAVAPPGAGQPPAGPMRVASPDTTRNTPEVSVMS